MMKLLKFSYAIIAAILLSCASGPKEPDAASALLKFFEACAGVDSTMVSRMSVVDSYPLATSWQIRRIGEKQLLLRTTLSSLDDSLASIAAAREALQQEASTLMDSLTRVTSRYIDTAKRLRQEYDRIDREYQEAHKDFKSARTNVIEKLNRASELGKKRNRALRRFLEAMEPHKRKAQEELSQIEELIQELGDRDSTLLVMRNDVQWLTLALQKSLSGLDVDPSELLTIQTVSVIADLQVPSQVGVILNKKCEVVLLAADRDGHRSKWIITKLNYLGE